MVIVDLFTQNIVLDYKEHVERLVKKGGFDLKIIGVNKHSKSNFIGEIEGRIYSCDVYERKEGVELRKAPFYADQEKRALAGELNFIIFD